MMVASALYDGEEREKKRAVCASRAVCSRRSGACDARIEQIKKVNLKTLACVSPESARVAPMGGKFARAIMRREESCAYCAINSEVQRTRPLVIVMLLRMVANVARENSKADSKYYGR